MVELQLVELLKSTDWNQVVNHYLVRSYIIRNSEERWSQIYIDTETSVSRKFLGGIGVDVSKMLYLHLKLWKTSFSY